jgi:hypothetical protein
MHHKIMQMHNKCEARKFFSCSQKPFPYPQHILTKNKERKKEDVMKNKQNILYTK